MLLKVLNTVKQTGRQYATQFRDTVKGTTHYQVWQRKRLKIKINIKTVCKKLEESLPS